MSERQCLTWHDVSKLVDLKGNHFLFTIEMTSFLQSFLMKAMADQIEQMNASLEANQKLISDLQQKYDSELQHSADLSKKLEVTEVSCVFLLVTLQYLNRRLIVFYRDRNFWTTQATYSLQQKKI